MNKTIIFLGMLLCMATTAMADEALTFNDLLDERIRLNKTYGDDFAEEAEGMDLADKLVPLEKKLGKEWVDFLTHVKKSGDPILKLHVLKIEYTDELVGCYYDLEYAEGVLEKVALKGKIVEWKEKLELLEKLSGDKPAKEDTKKKE